jgi:hypothetical protein
MVFFFIADLALTLAYKLGVWCLGKTYNGIAYLVTQSPSPSPSPSHARDDDDCVVVTITRHEYDALRKRDV